MPRKGETDTAAKVIDKAVKRHLEGGESVAKLSKELKVSKQTFYSWLDKYKQEVVTRLTRAGMSAEELERTTKIEMQAQIDVLQAENRKLRDRLISLMIKHNEIP